MTIRTHVERTGLVAALAAAALLLFPATSFARKKGPKHPSPPAVTDTGPGYGYGYGYGFGDGDGYGNGHGHFGPAVGTPAPLPGEGFHQGAAKWNKRKLRQWRKAQTRQYVRQVNAKLRQLNRKMMRAYRRGHLTRYELRRFNRQQRLLERQLNRAKRDGWVTWGEQASINTMLGGLSYGIRVAALF